MRLRVFDLLGVVAVVVFAAVLGADFQGLRSSASEVDPRLMDGETGRGFRPGVSWFGLYCNDDKVGFARLSRQRRMHGYTIEYEAVVDVEMLGSGQRVEARLQASLDLGFGLRNFDLAVASPILDVSATGVVADQEMDLVVTVGDIVDRKTVPLEDRPYLDIAVNALVLSRRPSVGEVFEIAVFDPFELRPTAIAVEYLGVEQIAVLDGAVSAHRLGRVVAGSRLDVWLNDFGEVLREELPLGITAVRETEAAATWGFRRQGDPRTERLALQPDMLGVLESETADGSAGP